MRDGQMIDRPAEYFSGSRADMLKYLPNQPKRSLEFGCGDGCFSMLLKEKFGTETWAVEIDEEAAKKATERLDKVIKADALEAIKEIPDNYFDAIIFFDILEHLTDPYNLLNKAALKLAKGGVVIASIPNIRYWRVLIDLVAHGNWEYQTHGVLDKTHLRFFTRKSTVKMFEESGFEILTLEGIHPTRSKNFKIINAIFLNAISDARFKQFAVVARPANGFAKNQTKT
jgi:2-polyprenyl-3-methyl-5-hydroxy-6-metoxy-1,4-benzoquinol methylase